MRPKIKTNLEPTQTNPLITPKVTLVGFVLDGAIVVAVSSPTTMLLEAVVFIASVFFFITRPMTKRAKLVYRQSAYLGTGSTYNK